ncbi:TPA: hypothetical protein QDC27_004794 [Burkholderia cepacia ATCC 25416]|uniref:YrhB domain-containing protein n=1 Tax=Burkholderia cepacia TaxID=292 RepID=UPI0018C49269|nr:YrhB domain-containing protein [Burkholderia cepacia]HDR9769529.1 hypothetical protein [Burkholderia cepacia ATCC 25416]MCA8076562.1 YrhB family protein [Burkholderia cepacia]HDR9776969.1 hypothetical protein [Burkholderia cepacia ATCC 25416]HDR9780377.1 hypothetical protein [Burkholderia cepacia ATCC 25416]HDR9788104.1 hypothetical protein [Burkholderia cepacia ATCC 25416]
MFNSYTCKLPTDLNGLDISWTLEQAMAQARRTLSSLARAVGITIIDAATSEFDVGWVFYYQSSRFLETGDVRDSLAGNAPLFVSRDDGRAISVSYHRPITESIQAHRACGDPNGYKESQVRLTRWLAGANEVQATRLIRQNSHMGLAEAKHSVDRCLAARETVIETKDVASAKQLVIDLAEVEFHAVFTYRSTRR